MQSGRRKRWRSRRIKQ
uniref:Uncharacterized protein n=1 Tax=Arundo donax TaxID=35708 RepID=A0A0A8Z2Z1_ARUDO